MDADLINTEFNNAVSFELQATPGLLSPLVGSTDNYEGSGKSRVENTFEEVSLEEVEDETGDTNLQEQASRTRWIKATKPADGATLIPRNQQKLTRVPLNSPAAAAFARAARRFHDIRWLQGYFSTAYAGEDGDTAVAFKAANTVAAGGAGLTLDKLIELNEMMGLADNDMDAEMPIVLITPKQKSDLLKINEYKNADFTPGAPLVRGEVKPFMGFRFIQFNPASPRGYGSAAALTLDGATRKLPAFFPSGLHRGVWTEFFGKISDRADKRHNEQIFAEARSTVTRLNEDKCFLLECTEA